MDDSSLLQITRLITVLRSLVKCPLCLDNIKQTIQLKCGHQFCDNCIQTRIEAKNISTCPLCNTDIYFKHQLVSYRDTVQDALSQFVESTCQLINERDTQDANQIFLYTNSIKKQTNSNSFLASYNNSVAVGDLVPISPANYSDIIEKVTMWLNRKENVFTSSSPSLKMLNSSSLIPKVISNSNKCGPANHSQSYLKNLIDNDNINTEPEVPMPYECNNLTNNTNDDYKIHDVSCEAAVIENNDGRKVLQQVLEDKCLDNFDNIASQFKSLNAETNNAAKQTRKKNLNQYKKLVSSENYIQTNQKLIKRKPKKLKISLENSKKQNLNKRINKTKEINDKSDKVSRDGSNKENEKLYPQILQKYNLRKNQDSKDQISEEKIEINIEPVTSNVAPVLIDQTANISEIIQQLSNQLDICVSSVEQSDPKNNIVVQCFNNMKNFINKLKLLNPQIKCNPSMHHNSTQTDVLHYSHQKVQTIDNHMLKSDKKSITGREQTHYMKLQKCNVKVQTENATMENFKDIIKESSRTKFEDKNILEEVVNTQPHPKKLPNICKVDIINGSGDSKSISKDSADRPIQNNSKLDVTNRIKTGKKYKRICSPPPAVMNDNYESDDIGPPSKKRFNANVTIEFLDSETTLLSHPKTTNDNNKDLADDMDYDQYLLEVMSKYDNAPNQKAVIIEDNKKEKSINHFGQIEKIHRPNDADRFKKIDAETNDHVFTSPALFENNLEKFEQEIMEHEKSIKPNKPEISTITEAAELSKSPKNSKHKSDILQNCYPIVSHNNTATSHNNISSNSIDNNMQLKTDDVTGLIDDIKYLNKILNENGNEVIICQHNGKGNKDNTSEQIDAKTKNESNNRVHILQNIKLNPPVEIKTNGHRLSNDSDETELIENTPQKKNGSTIFDLNLLGDKSVETYNIFPTPPPGFNDDDDDDEKEKVNNHEDKLVKKQIKYNNDKQSGSRELIKKNYQSPFTSTVSASYTEYTKSNEKEMNSSSQEIFTPICKSIASPNTFRQQSTSLLATPKCRSNTNRKILTTSTPNQKNILNYVRTFKSSPEDSFQDRIISKKPRVMKSRIQDSSVFLQVEKMKLMDISAGFDNNVTHLIVLADEHNQITFHTAKFILAVAAGIWIVRYEWVVDCLKARKILPEEPYEVLDSSGIAGPKISRLTSKINPLFQNFRFYCAEPFFVASKLEIQDALKRLGAVIERDLNSLTKSTVNDKKVKIILTDSTESEDLTKFDKWLADYNIVTVDIEWLAKCIGQYSIVSFRPHILCSDDDKITEDLPYSSTLMEPVLLTMSTSGV